MAENPQADEEISGEGDAPPAAPAPRRGPGHRAADARDTAAEMAARAHEISLEAGSKMSGAIEIIHPFPVPGTEAVFKYLDRRRSQYGQTSTVDRVVMRVRKYRVEASGADSTWDELTGRFQIR